MNRIPVISGNLETSDLGSVLEALTLTRQLSCVEIASPLGAPEGVVWVKAGQMLEANAGSRSGMEALRYLLNRPGRFEVFRSDARIEEGVEPMASIYDALEQARANPWSTGMQPIGVTPEVERTPSAGTPVVPANNAANNHRPEPVTVVHVAPPATASLAQPRLPSISQPPPRDRGLPGAPRPLTLPPPDRSSVRPPASVRSPQSVPRELLKPPTAGPVFAVFANKGGVGKTTFSINLAVTLARRGMKTTIVDADPRNDVGNAVSSRRDTSLGLFDVLDGSAQLRDVVLDTALPGLSILPAGGVTLPEDRFQAAQSAVERLANVMSVLSESGGVVVVDTPPGLRGITHWVLRASSHAIAMVQAEPIAIRAAAQVPRALENIPARERPSFIGVILNMLDRRVGASLGMLEEACKIFGPETVLDIALPRSGVFIEASEKGTPIALQDSNAGHSFGFLFESLASAVLARAGLSTPKLSEMRLL